MKHWILTCLLLVVLNLNAQNDTTYLSDWEYINVNYSSIINQFPNTNLLDYISGVDREFLKRFRTDSIADKNINKKVSADDWLGLYYGCKSIDRKINYEDSIFEFTQKLYQDWNKRTYLNEKLTLPIGVVLQTGTFIKDDAYSNQLNFSKSNNNFGWNYYGTDLASITETHDYFCASILYDEVLYDQEIILTFDTNYTVLSNKPIAYLSVNFQKQNYLIYPGDSIEVYLHSNSSHEIAINAIFSDSSSYTTTQVFETDNSFFDNEREKSSLFTGGKHTYTPTSLDLSPEIIETIFSSPEAFLGMYRLRYGIIWGECNTTGKINKPVIMLHGFRPTVMPIIPSLKNYMKLSLILKVMIMVATAWSIYLLKMDLMSLFVV